VLLGLLIYQAHLHRSTPRLSWDVFGLLLLLIMGIFFYYRCTRQTLTIRQLTAQHTRLLAQTAQLAHTNAELQRQQAALEEFTYMASHDLQEPLRKLVAFSRHLRQDLGANIPLRAAQDVDFIVDAASRMHTLVQDLGTLSRLGATALPWDWVPLQACVDQALAGLALRVQETQACIRCAPLPMVWGNQTLLTQLYQNLLDNACKFTGNARPQIRVTARQWDRQWVLGVQDWGIGIKAEDLPRLFTPFTRLHSRGEYPGAGLGLAICRKVVAVHGGRLWVESPPEGGTHFQFTLAPYPVTPGGTICE
jgi:light-regulated signal transduction histidine kinase (bacteriophytochrome)